jgi:hypothetical protein
LRCWHYPTSATLPEPRLTTEFQVSAIRRLVEANGDFVTILRKGDGTSGTILLIGQVKGANPVLFERFRPLDGEAIWRPVAPQANENEKEIVAYWQKRVAQDPDLWVLELDVASTERLNRFLGTLA